MFYIRCFDKSQNLYFALSKPCDLLKQITWSVSANRMVCLLQSKSFGFLCRNTLCCFIQQNNPELGWYRREKANIRRSSTTHWMTTKWLSLTGVSFIGPHFFISAFNSISIPFGSNQGNLKKNWRETKGNLKKNWRETKGNLKENWKETKGNLKKNWRETKGNLKKTEGKLKETWRKTEVKLKET